MSIIQDDVNMNLDYYNKPFYHWFIALLFIRGLLTNVTQDQLIEGKYEDKRLKMEECFEFTSSYSISEAQFIYKKKKSKVQCT